jgi:hypothetical protein
MERTVLSAEDIRKRVQKLVNAIPEIVDDDAKVDVPLPKWHESDRDGCNWDMGSFRGGSDYETEVREAVEHVREKFNLAGK